MKTKNSIGLKIKEFREFRQISRSDLAFKANLDLKIQLKINRLNLSNKILPIWLRNWYTEEILK